MIGSVARVPTSVKTGRLTQDTVKLVFRNPNSTDKSYLYWLLRTPQYRDYCAGHATGSAVVALSRRDFLDYPVPSPTGERKTAVALLDSIEERIDVNRRISDTLQAMGRAIFDSWFVNFDAILANTRGNKLELPASVARLFPDHFDESDLGKVPLGWSVKTIGDLAEIVGGGTPSTKESAYWQDGVHYWATPKDLSALAVPVLLETERRVTDIGLSQISSGLLPAGTVLLSSRAPIGYLAVAEVPVAINQGFIAMKPKNDTSNLFLLFWAKSAHDDILSRANGSTFLEISKSNFRPIPLIAPPGRVMVAFDRIVRPLYERIVAAERESRALAALRDSLLLKLLSGELRVSEGETIVELTANMEPVP